MCYYFFSPSSYFPFQPALHDWCNKGRGMTYPVCRMMHIKKTLLLIGKNSPCAYKLCYFMGVQYVKPLSVPLPAEWLRYSSYPLLPLCYRVSVTTLVSTGHAFWQLSTGYTRSVPKNRSPYLLSMLFYWQCRFKVACFAALLCKRMLIKLTINLRCDV